MLIDLSCNVASTGVIPIVERRGRDIFFRFPSGREVALSNGKPWNGTPYPVAIREAWADYLGRFNWQVVFTGTSARVMSADRMFREMRVAINCGAHRLFGRRFYRQGIRGLEWFASLERQQSGSPHVHALISGVQPDGVQNFCSTLFTHWDVRVGRATAEPIESIAASCRYVSKELAGAGDWQCSRDLRNVSSSNG